MQCDRSPFFEIPSPPKPPSPLFPTILFSPRPQNMPFIHLRSPPKPPQRPVCICRLNCNQEKGREITRQGRRRRVWDRRSALISPNRNTDPKTPVVSKQVRNFAFSRTRHRCQSPSLSTLKKDISPWTGSKSSTASENLCISRLAGHHEEKAPNSSPSGTGNFQSLPASWFPSCHG